MKLANFIERFKLWIILGSLAFTVAIGVALKDAEVDSNLKNFIPKELPSRINSDRMEEIFGASDPVMILLKSDDVLNRETLLRIKRITKSLNRKDEVSKMASLFTSKDIKGIDGAMVVDPAVKRIPKTDEQKEVLRNTLKQNTFAYGMIVSENFKYTGIVVTPAKSIDDQQLTSVVESALEEFPGEEEVLYGGVPYIRKFIEQDINKDFGMLMPIALLIMLFFLYFSFREKRGVLLPFSVVILSIVIAMGLIPLIGWKVTMLSVLAPIMMIAIANNYGIHYIARYQELNAKHPNMSMSDIVKNTITHLKAPTLMAGLTTVVGILGLLSHIMKPARQLGVVAALGVVFALLLSMFFIPAFLFYLKKGKPIASFSEDKKSFLATVLNGIADFVVKAPKTILIVTAVLALVAGMGIFSIKVDSDSANMFPADHPVKISTNVINEEFGGSLNMNIMVEGDIKDPVIMKAMEQVELELDGFKGVGDVFSIATALKEMSKAINEPGDPFYNKIPDSREAIAQYLELYSMNGDPEDFEQMVDFDFTKAIVTIRVSDASQETTKAIVAKVEEIIKGFQFDNSVGGYLLMQYDLARFIVQGQTNSLIFAVLAIAIMIGIIFCSFWAAFIGSIPLLMADLLLFGTMGYAGIKLDTSTAMLSSIMIGIGVDYTIHFMHRYRHQLSSGNTAAEAVRITLNSTGRGIVLNAFSVMIGFCVLFISAFLSLKLFGFLIIFSILSCLLSAIIIIPALALVFKPKFFNKSNA